MTTLVLLTQITPSRPVYVNLDHVAAFHRDEADTSTVLRFIGTGIAEVYQVTETPAEIIALVPP